MEPHQAHWYERFRFAAYLSVVGLMAITLVIILPFHPFSYLPPIIVGGGPGVWFLLGYVLLATVGFGGLAGLSALFFEIETDEGRRPQDTQVAAGLVLFCIGVFATCFLLLLAGASGGYAATIEGASSQSVESILSPYLYPVTLTSFLTVVGAGLLVLGMAGAKAPSIE